MNSEARPKAQSLSMLSPLSFSTFFILSQVCKLGWPSYSEEKTLRRKALFKGMSKVKDSLDVVKLIRQSRALKVLLRLLLS